MDRDREGLLLFLLQEGSTNHAVQLYREETGASQEEAKRAVDDVAAQHGIRVKRDRLLPLALIGAAGLLGALLAFRF
jgi:hypothetical protein